MQQAIELAGRLNKQIQSSEEYKRYLETDRRLKENIELYGRYNEFRRRNYELQYSEGDSNLYDEVLNMIQSYRSL